MGNPISVGGGSLTVKEVAELLRISPATVWRYAKNGTLPKPFKLGGRTLWDKAEVQEVIERQKAVRLMPKRPSGAAPGTRTTATKKWRRRVRLNEPA